MTPAYPSEAIHGFRFHALGGHAHLRLAGLPADEARDAAAGAVAWLRATEALLSRFNPASLVSRLNRGETIAPHPDLLDLLEAGRLAREQTSGRLNPAAFPLWQLWHDPPRAHPPAPSELSRALALQEPPVLSPDGSSLRPSAPGAALDLSGLGKEWCVDRLVSFLEQRGLRHFLVELSGDLAARGRQPNHDGWWVLLPGAPAALLLRNAALATSGNSRRRAFPGCSVSHLVDASNGQPASGAVLTATVRAPTCLEACILSSDTALAPSLDEALARARARPAFLRTAERSVFTDPALAQACRPLSPPAAA